MRAEGQLGEDILAKRGPELIDPRLAKALEHPIRIKMLGILWEGPSSPARIKRRLGDVSLNLVSHHIKVLKELGCIELVETVKKRGAREHIYRAVELPVVSDEEWARMEPAARHASTIAILRLISDDLARALGSGRFEDRLDRHLSRSPLKLDEEGWTEVMGILERTLGEVLEAGTRSLKRIEKSGEPSTPMTVAIMGFPTD